MTDGDRPAIITQDGTTYSYRQIYSLSDELAAPLGNSKKLVFLRCQNTPRVIAAYLACLRHGHAALLLNEDMDVHMFRRLKELYRPDFIFSDTGAEAIMEPQGEIARTHPLHPKLALLLSTSGSTGSPKLVRLTQDNLQANAASIAEYLQLNEQERPITNLPMYYSYGLSVINSHLHAGACLLLTKESLISPDFWKFCDSYGATSMAGVPYTYDMLDAIGFRKRAPHQLSSMTQAGGHMDAEKVLRYAEWAEEHDIRLYIMYGQTEATARMSYLPPHMALTHPNSIGYPVPGGCFRLADDSGKTICDTGVNGELIYTGPNVCMGYAESEADLSLGDVFCGELHTGDVAYVDTDGLYYITGRLKRFLKIAGNRFSLDELETHFLSKGVQCVCGGKDGKLLIAITDADKKDFVTQYIKNTWHLLRHQYNVSIIESIPRSSTGKILYQNIFR